jgi:hypothetical protein
MTKFQTPSSKYLPTGRQEFQSPKFKTKPWVLEIGYWLLFGDWCLMFGYSIKG